MPRARVVIVGAGFAGFQVVRTLVRSSQVPLDTEHAAG